MAVEMLPQEYNVDDFRGRPLGRVMVKMKKVTREQVHEGLAIQKERGGPIGQILVDLEYITSDVLAVALGLQAGMEFVDLEKVDIPEEVIRQVPAQMASAYKVIPISYDLDENHLTIAIASPDNFHATDDLQTLMGFKVTAKIAGKEDLELSLARHYDVVAGDSIADLINEMADDAQLSQLEDRGESIDLDTIREMVDSSPVKRLLNTVLLQAIRDKASDIHFEPFEDEFKMRYRIDGMLYEMLPPPKHIAVAIASRLKVMANLDIAERRLPQDGRIELLIDGNPVDLRVAVLPTMFGESVVLRVLDRSQVNLDLERIGFREDELQAFKQIIERPNGVVIVTGPTGSGKTTTLYSALEHLNDPETKILTSEDPVEYDLDGLVQVAINADIDLTFARCLRSFLRQDPDIILVGEVRDLETAEIAVQSALTGHLVFTTLHTNDAASTIARLLDLGIEAFLITATVEAIVAQRLVRRICPRCKEEYTPTTDMLMELELTPDAVAGRTFSRGVGCDYCRGTGYSGRLAVFEILTFDDQLRLLIQQHASTTALRELARKRGMRTLREAGLLAIYDGMTTIEEVSAQTIAEELD